MDSTVKLDKVQRAALMKGYLRHALALASIRCQMLLLLDDGHTVEHVARLTYGTVQEVEDCVKWFREGGVEATVRGS